MKKVLSFLLICLVTVSFVSCDLTGNGGGSTNKDFNTPDGAIYEGSILIGASVGSYAGKIIKSETDWVVNNKFSWYSLSTLYGTAGETELMVRANSANEDTKERVGYFVIEGDTTYVIQRGVVYTEPVKSQVLVNPGKEEISVLTKGTFPSEQFEITSDASWAKFDRVELVKEREILEDEVTESSYNEAAIIIKITSENTETENRKANLTIKAGEETINVTLVQLGPNAGEVDFSKEFYRGHVGYKFTGTWCGNCPYLGGPYHEVKEANPGRFLILNIYNGDMAWSGNAALESFFGVNGWPTGYLNACEELVPGEDNAYTIQEKMDKFAINHPSTVAIAATSEVVDGKAKITVKLASVEGNDYKLNVFFMEDGIVGKQADYNTGYVEDPDNYVHDDILRGSATADYATGGETIELPIGEVITEVIEAKIPEDIVNQNNARLLIFVTSPLNNREIFVDNAIDVPLVNGSVDFRYEE